jgi:acyl-[acyl carrier protein]--UDP-N-acetylglucosamine O-acyltransferase
LWSVIGGISIPVRCQIGGGLQMPHTNGIVINVGAKIGCNCDIYQQVTIGEMKGGLPTIGNNVFIGPGAKILGDVKIGDGACIGANALVISDVPAGARVFRDAVGDLPGEGAEAFGRGGLKQSSEFVGGAEQVGEPCRRAGLPAFREPFGDVAPVDAGAVEADSDPV